MNQSMDREKIIIDWIKAAYNRTGSVYNVRASNDTAIIASQAEAYLETLKPVPTDRLALFLRKAEENYNLENKIPTASQVKEFWHFERRPEDDIRNRQETGMKFTPKQWRCVCMASKWQSNGQMRNKITDEIMIGIGLIIGDMAEQAIKSTVSYWQKITGREIILYKAGK